MTTDDRWLPTGHATAALGLSADTLKRYADRDCFLVEGTHFRFGPYKNSARVWNVPACAEALAYRGRLQRKKLAEAV